MTKKFIDAGYSPEGKKKEVAEINVMYDKFMNAHKLTQAQAYAFAMRLLTELLYELDESKRPAMVNKIIPSLITGLRVRCDPLYDDTK